MKQYKTLNNVFGWLAFAVAMFTYGSTIEPTASFWDCGEFIATAYKLQIGHPPGAPFFMILGRVATLFAFGDVTKVAMMMNLLSALMSALSILFLFWTITHLTRKLLVKKGEEPATGALFAILGSGLVGSLAYTFSDTFWFSAVEGEVYATSSFFTAIVFWAMLKWEEVADEPHADRYIILIAYLMGISIGIHLLNLLAIPAIAYIYYFKKYEPTRAGIFYTGVIGALVLGLVQFAFIPKVVGNAAVFELLFTNAMGMPFWSGTIIYIILLIATIFVTLSATTKGNAQLTMVSFSLLLVLVLGTYGVVLALIRFAIRYFTKQSTSFVLINTLTLCITVMLIGYASYGMIVIRSSADTPMDENNPENVFTLLSYLNREQYGTRPLLYGQYFNAQLHPEKDKRYTPGNTVYAPNYESGKYDVVATPKDTETPNYDPEYCTVFPRMWSSQSHHIKGYKTWANIKDTKKKPSFGQNLTFFFKYQLGFMYFRYFAWNFIGRQNDIQGHGSISDGNWKSGLNFIDDGMLGTQENLPPSLADNKANNKFYFLPLILGLIGLAFQYGRSRKDFLVVGLFFFFTGIAIILFLNQYTMEPRERDYGFAGSFYAFTIWIGFGVAAIYEGLKKFAPGPVTALGVTVLCTIAVPGIMAKGGWDDHNRADRYTARDFASNYLNSCEKNAILFTNGDNDTFPLWYAQEVEGVRTDVRVVNLSLLNTDWYIDQIKRKAYDSDAVPLSLTQDKYRQGKRDQIIIYEEGGLQGYQNIREMMDFVASDNPAQKLKYSGRDFDYFPSNKFSIPVDSAQVLANGTVPPELASRIVKTVNFEIDRNYILKSELMILDLLATNNWERPIYFAITVGDDSYLGLEDYFQLEGLAYRLIPVKNPKGRGDNYGRINTDKMYDNIMNKFRWGGLDTSEVYMDENNIRMTMNLRSNFDRLAEALIAENKKDSALKVLDKSFVVLPEKNVPYNFFVVQLAEDYYKAGETAKPDSIIKHYADIVEQELDYYFSQKPAIYKEFDSDAQRDMSILRYMIDICRRAGRKEMVTDLDARFRRLEQSFLSNTGTVSGSRD
ncbi:MAG: DUF2723 domain-containing protein [Bacteroidetes bacterium]|nr:DUF2723 domain-containing protein [Bacteroidota bacterium]